MTPLERAHALVHGYAREVDSELPADALLFDVHTHLGHDLDGSTGEYEELTAGLDRHGFAGAFTFCLDEPDRAPSFSAPNDRTLAHAERSEGRLVPFVRLDLTERPLAEARRCLDLGARGIKLHPRAQAFALDDERLGPIFALAVERDVPILVHGGRGLPPIAPELASLVERNAGVRLIVAHAGIADMADLTTRLSGTPGVFFDTSVWSAVDVLTLFWRIAPEQIVYASDYPYGRLPNSLLLAVRCARLAGFDELELRMILGENARRIVDREPPLEPGTPRGGASLHQPLTLSRIHQYISMAAPMLWLRQRDAIGALGLAVNASRTRGAHDDEAERIEELLTTARDLWQEALELAVDAERRSALRLAIQLVVLADLIAVTTPA